MRVENLRCLLSKTAPHIPEIIGSGVLLEQTKAVLYGVFKGGKSTMLTNVGLSVAGGLSLFGDHSFPTLKSRVLYIQLEIPEKAFRKRLSQSSLSQLPDVLDNFFPYTEFWLKLDKDDGLAKFIDLVEEVSPQLVIIDPAYKVLSGNENSVEDWTRVFDNIDILMEKYKFALIFSAQGRKTQVVPKHGKVDLGDEELRGSTAIQAWVDSIIGLRVGTGNKRHVNMTLRNGVKETMNIVVDFDKQSGLYTVV